jgi:hypothetical protein
MPGAIADLVHFSERRENCMQLRRRDGSYRMTSRSISGEFKFRITSVAFALVNLSEELPKDRRGKADKIAIFEGALKR